MNQPKHIQGDGSGGAIAQVLPLRQRLSQALLNFSSQMASVKTGALVQVWMPEQCADGTVVLSAQGLPFAVAGVGDLLALFRCVSVRYRFSTDVMKPSLMGAIGRVYATLEPEMSHDVQKYDKQVYLRVSEAQRCRVHSTLCVPVFEKDHTDKPLAVFELVQNDKDVVFPAVMSWLRTCLENVNLTTCHLDQLSASAGLRKWPMHVEQSLGGDGGGPYKRLTANGDGEGEETSTRRKAKGDEMMDETSEVKAGRTGRGSLMGSQAKLERLSREVDQGGSVLRLDDDGGPGPSGAGDGPTKSSGSGKEGQMAQLMSWMHQNGLGPDALQTLKAFMASGQVPKLPGMPGSSGAGAGTSTAGAGKGGKQVAPTKQLAGQRRQAEDEDDDNISSDGGDDDDDDEDDENGRRANNNNRVGGGAGKRLQYEDLQAQFGLGLKEAAANLGICATTLKRACRRHGIKRWPRRQIAKLSKALNQMGYQGVPPPSLVHSAVTQAPTPAEVAAAQAAAAAAAAVAPSTTQTQPSQFQPPKLAGKAAPQGLQVPQPQPQSTQAAPQMPMAPPPHLMAHLPGMGMLAGMPGQPPGMIPPPGMNPYLQHPGMGGPLMPHLHGMAGLGGIPGLPGMAHPHAAFLHHQAQAQAHAAQAHAAHAQAQAHAQAHANAAAAAVSGLEPGSTGSLQGQASMGFNQSLMHFMYNDMNGRDGNALVNELVPGPGNMMMGGPSTGREQHQPSAMHISSSALLPVMNRTSIGNLGGVSEMNIASNLSMPNADVLDALDAPTPSLGAPPMHSNPTASNGVGVGEASSQAQLAALHELFKNAPGSLESFMELLSDDLPLVQ